MENKKPVGRPKMSEGEMRATFVVNKNQLEKIRHIAYCEDIHIKDVIKDALDDYIAKYEYKHGVVEPIKGHYK